MRKIAIVMVLLVFIVCLGGAIIVGALDNNKINVLIYGVDGREGEEVERSDAIILVNYDFNESKIVATSIPRDSYVKITCKNNKYDKINHSYAYGKEECLNSTVEQLFGIKNVKNVVFDFESVVEMVDYFGLIELSPAHSFCQSDEKGKITYCFEKDKKIQIDGNQALAYMRARKNLANGDFDRMKNQRQIMKILINKFINLSLVEKMIFYNYVKKIVKTDLTFKDLNVKKIINVQQITLNEYTLKGEDYINTYYYYKLDPSYLEKIKKYYI